MHFAAVHSVAIGTKRRFIAARQFGRFRTKADIAARTRCLFPPPGLRERGHRRFACRAIAVRRLPLAWIEAVRPQPRCPDRRGRRVHDPADHAPVREHVVIVVVPSPDGREVDARLRIS